MLDLQACGQDQKMVHSGSSSLTRCGHLYPPWCPTCEDTAIHLCRHLLGPPGGEPGWAWMDELLSTHGPTLLHESSLSTIWRAPWNSPGAHEF